MKIISREGWGADDWSSPPTKIPLPTPRLVLHHTDGKDEGTSTILKIQRYHMNVKGWRDIAYSWLYSPLTRRFYEGRGAGVAGAHTKGYNTTAHALCILGRGQYDDLSPDNISDLGEFTAWHSQYGPDRFTHGHRDLVATACPGANFYACIPQINATPTDWFDMATKDELRSLIREEIRDDGWIEYAGRRLSKWFWERWITGKEPASSVLLDARDKAGTNEGASLSDADVDRIVDRFVERLAS